MNVTKNPESYAVFLRACEGLPVLVLVAAVLAAGWLLRKGGLLG